MSKLGDNDEFTFMLMDERGNAMDSVKWDEARTRLAAYFTQPSGVLGWAENQAENVLTTMLTGRFNQGEADVDV